MFCIHQLLSSLDLCRDDMRTDFLHLLSRPFFSVAFLFNWIGFFLSFCLTTSAAGRYGAISGFGLSLVKWILIVRVRDADITQHTYKHINCGLMYAQANQKPQTPLWYFNAVSVVAGLLAPNCFLKDPFENCAASLICF